MSEIATPGQLRMSYWRWAMVLIPALVLLGSLSGLMAGGSSTARWLDALDLPAMTPQDWVFRVAGPVLFVLQGLSLAMLLHARGARGRGVALLLFVIQLLAMLAWTPLFFAMHQVTAALYLVIFALAAAIATMFALMPVRRAAAWLLVPSVLWLGFAAILNFQIDQRNPDAETLVPHVASTQI